MREKSQVSSRYIDAITVLGWAAENNQPKILRELLAQGIDVNAKDSGGTGNTALIYAAMGGKAAITKILLAYGADPNLANSDWSPLLYAAWANGGSRSAKDKANVHTTIKALLAHGAKVNYRDQGGQTAFSLAACVGTIPILRTLIGAGARILTKNKAGDSALIGALQFRRFRTVEFLLQNGVPINARNKEGKSSLVYAIEWEDQELIDFLKSHGAKE